MVRIRRRLSSLAFLMRRAHRRIVTARPPSILIAAAAIAITIFLLGGGVYNILEEPLALIGGPQGRWIFYYPYALHEQTLSESLVVMLLYAMGVVGFLLLYQSTKYAYRPRQAFILLIMGAAFLVLAYLYCEYVLGLKMGI